MFVMGQGADIRPTMMRGFERPRLKAPRDAALQDDGLAGRIVLRSRIRCEAVFFTPTARRIAADSLWSSAAPRTFLGAAPVDDLINPERNTRQMATKLQTAGVPVTLQFYPRTNHMTLIGAFAGPLRFLAPVLDDVVEFVNTTPPR